MKLSALVAGICAIATVSAVDGAVKLDFDVIRGSSKEDSLPGQQGKLVKRETDGSVEYKIANEQSYYRADLLIGSNKDKVSVVVDTGSADLWVMLSKVHCEQFNYKREEPASFSSDKSEKATKSFTEYKEEATPEAFATGEPVLRAAISYPGLSGSGEPLACTYAGSFATEVSNSWKQDEIPFLITEDGLAVASGVWGTDTVELGNISVPEVRFAVVTDSNTIDGVLGLGFNFANVLSNDNLVSRMKSAGLIKKAVYSLALGKEDSNSGSLLFGAIDKAKYTGNLVTVPLVPGGAIVNSEVTTPPVLLNKLTFNEGDSQTVITLEIPVLLDTISTFSYFPLDLFNKVVKELSAKEANFGIYSVDCALAETLASFVFSFNGIDIKVPISDFILKNGDMCFLGISEQEPEDKFISLGDNFIRNAYLVYDLEEFTISMAQATFSSDENIQVVELPSLFP